MEVSCWGKTSVSTYTRLQIFNDHHLTSKSEGLSIAMFDDTGGYMIFIHHRQSPNHLKIVSTGGRNIFDGTHLISKTLKPSINGDFVIGNPF